MAEFASFSPSSGWGAGYWPAPGPRPWWRAAAAPLAILAVLLGLVVPASGSGMDPGRLAALAQRVAQVGPAIAGQAFAGVYVDGNARRVHVELTSTDQAPRLAQAVGGSGQVEIDRVGRSRKDLIALRDRIAGDRRSLAAEGVQVLSVGPDYERNRVVVGVASMTPAVVSLLQGRYGADSVDVRQARPSSFLDDDEQGQPTQQGQPIQPTQTGVTQTGTTPQGATQVGPTQANTGATPGGITPQQNPGAVAPQGAGTTSPTGTTPLGQGVAGGMGIVQLIQEAQGTAEIICTLGYVVEQAVAAAQQAPATNPLNPADPNTGLTPQTQPQSPVAQPTTNPLNPTQTGVANPALPGAAATTGINAGAPLQTQGQATGVATAGITGNPVGNPTLPGPAATNTGAAPQAQAPAAQPATNPLNPTQPNPAAAPQAQPQAQGGQVYGLTAGHCLQANSPFFQIGANMRPTVEVGTPVAKTDGTQGAVSAADAGLLMINGAMGSASPTVTTNQGQLQVVDAADPVQGQQACKFGVRTGLACGVVTATDQTDTFSEGQGGPSITVKNLATFVNQQGQPLCNNGDSGGPVFLVSGQGQVDALGLVTGGPDNNLASCDFTTLAPTIQALQAQGFSLGLLVASSATTPAQPGTSTQTGTGQAPGMQGQPSTGQGQGVPDPTDTGLPGAPVPGAGSPALGATG